MRRRRLILILLLIVGLPAGCGHAPDVAVQPETPAEISTDFGRLASVLEGIRKSGEVVLYEGLPSEFWEPELREQEARQKRTITLHGYAFYHEPQDLGGTEAERFTALFSARGSFKRYRSQKACGGYHPDYCVEWKSGTSTTRALICVECGEVKLIGPRAELHCDLMPEAGEKLMRWLAPHQKNRPVDTTRG